jgi:hypothetical protein
LDKSVAGCAIGGIEEVAAEILAHLLAQDALEKLEILVVDVDPCRYDRKV